MNNYPLSFNEIDAALNENTAEKESATLGRSIAVGAMTDNPDSHAEVLKLSDETGLPTDTVARNKDEIIKRKKQSDADIQLIFNEAPETKSWLSDKDNAALVSDDFSVLGTLKKTFTDLPKSWQLGQDTNELINLRAAELNGGVLSQEHSARADALSAGIETKTGTGGWFSEALNQTARNLPQLGYSAVATAKGAAQGATAGGIGAFLLGQMGPQVATPEEVITVPAAAMIGGRAGAIAGGAYESYRQQSALAFDDMLKIKDDAGNKLDRETARGASIAVGLITAPLDFVGLDKLSNTVPGVAALKQTIARDGLKKALQVPGARAAFLAVGKRFATGVTTEGLTEAAQEAVQIMGEELAKAASDGNFESPTMGQATARVLEAGKTGALVAGALGSVGSAGSLPLEIKRSREFSPDQVGAHVDAINEAVKTSTLFQRSPERFRALVSDIAGEDRFYINSTAALDAVNSMSPDDRLALFNSLPDLRDELETAAATNADISLNKADYATYIAPLEGAEKLRDFIKLDPADMSIAERNEYQDFIQNNPDVMQNIQAEIQNQPMAPQETFDAVERVVRQAMQDAGRPASEASAVAPLFARTLSRFAAPFGQNAMDVLNQTDLQFQQISEDGTPISSGSNIGVMLKNLSAIEAGQEVKGLDDVGKEALASFGQRLDALGITAKEALAMGAKAVGEKLNPSGSPLSFNQAAFHGTPHKFEKFTLDHIGTGEGAQAYGWGLYFASNKAIAEFYREQLAPPTEIKDWSFGSAILMKNGNYVDYSPRDSSTQSTARASLVEDLLVAENDIKAAYEEKGIEAARDMMLQIADEKIDSAKSDWPESVPILKVLRDRIAKELKFNAVKDKGQVYEVKIPEADVMLDWDAPYEKQPRGVKEALKASGVMKDYKENLSDFSTPQGTRGRNKLGQNIYQFLEYKLGSDRAASEFLNSHGIKGIKYKDANSRVNDGGSHNFVVFDDSTIEVLSTFYQPERGKIEMDAALRKVVISFTSRANFSTAAHEFSHFGVAMHRNFAELARARIALGDDTPELQRIAGDWEALKNAVGAESDTFTVDQEEKLARMFEAYLREGEAPSEGLRRVFTRFRDWLTKIYQDVSQLGPVHPEVKAVFDRWLASEEEIAAVQDKNSSLAEIATALGLSGDIAAKVADYANSARMRAEETLYKQLAREQKRREGAGYKKEFARVREIVADEFAKKPVFAALSFLRDNGMKLYVGSREIAEQQFDFSPPDAEPATLADYDALMNAENESEQLRESAIRVLLSPRPKKPVSLFQVLRALGGIKDSGGELKHLGMNQKSAPGVIRKGGLSLDYAREALVERGFLNEDSTVADALDLISQEASGKPVYSPADLELAYQWHAVDEAERIATDMGIDLEAERFARRGLGNYADVFTKDPSAAGAVAPDEAAEMHGFESGTDLLRALRSAPQFDRAVNAETRTRLLNMYPDMVIDGRIQNKAVEAIVNDRVLLALDLMIKELGGNRKVSMRQFAKAIAQQQIGKMKMREVNYAFRYEVAREKALRDALKASRSSKPDEAMGHLQRAMVNQVIFKELTALKDTRAKAEKLFKRVNDKDRDLAPNVDLDFLGAARAILHKYGLGGEKFNLAQWQADIAQRDPDLQNDLAAFLDLAAADEKPARDLTTKEFTDVYNAVQNIFHVARKMREFERGDRVVKTKDAVAQISEKLAEMKPAPKIEGTQVYGKARVHSNLMALKALVRRVEHWAQNIDGGFGGPARSYIWQPISEASVSYRDARSKWIRGLHEILTSEKERLTETGKIATKMQKYDGTQMIFRDRMELIGFLLHTGNDSNLDKLLGGYGIERAAYDQEIARMQRDGTLTKADYDLVQKLWDFAEDLKPISQNAHKKLYGFRFEEIEPTQFLTLHGAYRGGYWPAVVDRDQVDMKAPEDQRFLLASTNKGFTKSRQAGFRRQLSTDLRLAGQHVDQVLRFAYLEPAVSQVRRLLNDSDFKSSLKAVDARAYSDMLAPWLDRVARQITAEPAGTGGENLMGRGARFLRQSASAQTMMGNVGNAVQNFTGFTIAMHQTGVRNFAKAFAEYVASPNQIAKEIKEQSAFMRVRQNVTDIDIGNEIKEIVMRAGYYTKIKDAAIHHGYILQRISQGIVDNVTWTAAYSKAQLEEKSEAESVAYADSVVRMTQSSSAPEDISKIEAGSELGKPLLMFYTYFNNLANLVGTESDTIMRKYGWNGSPQLFYLYMMTISLPAVMGDLIVKGLRDDLPRDDDDDGEILDDWLAYLAGSNVRFVTASIPYLGQAFNAALNVFNKKPLDDRITASPVISQAETTLRFISKEIRGTYTDKSQEVRDGLNAIGFLTGLPLGRLGKPLGFAADVAEGDAQPQNAADYMRGFAGGPAAAR